jgi:phosphosulfolactate phosphohydrolase-like enzyme
MLGQMRISRSSFSFSGSDSSNGASVAVVIDVLRATSTAAVLLGRGVSRLRVATVEEAAALPPDRHLLVSERLPGGIDNSPALAASLDLETVRGRELVLVTTNGTRALEAAAKLAPRVLAASFLNLSATAKALAGEPAVTLVPAGDFDGQVAHLEDELCADALAAALAGTPLALGQLFERIRNEPRVLRRLQREPILQGDLELALTADLHPIAISFARDAEGLSWLTPA